MQAQLSTAVCNNIACAKFAAHSEGEIGPDNWTRVKMNIFLTKIDAIAIDQLLDSYIYCRYFTREVTLLCYSLCLHEFKFQ